MAVDGLYTIKSGISKMMNGYQGEERYDTSHGLEEAFASVGAMTGNEKLGRGMYLATTILNPASASGKIKAGIIATETVVKASGKAVKAVDKVADASKSIKGAGEGVVYKRTNVKTGDEYVHNPRAWKDMRRDKLSIAEIIKMLNMNLKSLVEQTLERILIYWNRRK